MSVGAPSIRRLVQICRCGVFTSGNVTPVCMTGSFGARTGRICLGEFGAVAKAAGTARFGLDVPRLRRGDADELGTHQGLVGSYRPEKAFGRSFNPLNPPWGGNGVMPWSGDEVDLVG